MRVDPRAQLAWLAAALVAVLAGGVAGPVAVAALSLGALAVWRETPRLRRTLIAVAPLALGLLLIDALAGAPAGGLLAALRIVALALAAAAFSVAAEVEELLVALRWLRLPYDIAFALVSGTRLVPLAASDLVDLTDAARLRGIAIDGGAIDRVRSWSRLLVPLLVVTIRRGLRLGEAMEARGFSADRPRTLRATLRWRLADTVLAAAAAVFAFGVILLPR